MNGFSWPMSYLCIGLLALGNLKTIGVLPGKRKGCDCYESNVTTVREPLNGFS
jgi:hypothetical protein